MALDTRQLRLIMARFRTQYALEIGVRALFYGLLAALVVILADKSVPFPVTWEPGYLALGLGLGIGILAGGIAHLKRFKVEEAARAVDAHYALKEQLGSAFEMAETAPDDFTAALTDQANRLATATNFTQDFRLRPPRYTRHASTAAVCAGLLLFAPPFQSLFPQKRAEMKELRERQTQLTELSKELKEIRKEDKELEQLAQRLEDLATRAQKNRLSKEDFLKELDEVQKQLESEMKELNKEGTAEALKQFEESLKNLTASDDKQQRDMAAMMESLKEKLNDKSMRFDDLDKLEKSLKEQEDQLAEHPELKNLEREVGKMREEALKQQQEKLGGEVDRLLNEMQKEAKDGSQKTPADLKQKLQQETQQLQQENQQGDLKKDDLGEVKDANQAQKSKDPAAGMRMESLIDKLEKALSKEQQLNDAKEQQASKNEQQAKEAQQGKENPSGDPSDQSSDQSGDKQGQGKEGSNPGEKQSGEGQKGSEGQKSQGGQEGQPTQGGEGQQSVEAFIEQQGGAQSGQSGQPLDSAPQTGGEGDGAQPGGSGQGKGSSGMSVMSKEEAADWAKMLEEYKDLDNARSKAGSTRSSGGKPGMGGQTSPGGSGWGLGHDPIGIPDNQGGGQAPDKNGMSTQQNSKNLEQLLDFQAVYDPRIIDAETRDNVKLNGQIQAGESGGFTMIKAPNTEEGDATTPYFAVDPATADSEVQALEDQEIPANLKDLVRQYFEGLDK